ncbi:MAG: endolytic transglycosylase MltG, partial [Proteobacteria bacterium]|nr:endolytic transglycosylase MltG [Pseudomonadota bacterium]
MKRLFIRGSIFTLVLILVVGSAGIWIWRDAQSVLDKRISLIDGPELFEIKRGTSLATIARNLHDKGWLTNEHYLRLEARRRKIAGNLQAGLYEVVEGATPRQLLEQFVSGQVKVFRITFIEGTTFREIREVLSSNKYVKSTIADKDDSWVAAQISSASANIEGQIFPATYYFSYGEQDIDILRRAYNRMQQVLEFEWQKRAPDLPFTTPYEALIMASIIEKETGDDRERAD